MYMPIQWETPLKCLCNIVSHWLGACTKWSLLMEFDFHNFFISQCHYVLTVYKRNPLYHPYHNYSCSILQFFSNVLLTASIYSCWIDVIWYVFYQFLEWQFLVESVMKMSSKWWHFHFCVYQIGQVTKLRLSCYLVLLSIDSKTR